MEQELARLKKTLAMIDFKCWYYTQALATGSENFTAVIPEGLPEEIRALYDASHGEESCGKNGQTDTMDYKGGAICRSGNFYRMRNS